MKFILINNYNEPWLIDCLYAVLYEVSSWRMKNINECQVIVREAAKAIQDVGKSWKLSTVTGEVETISRKTSLTEGQPILRSPAKTKKVI